MPPLPDLIDPLFTATVVALVLLHGFVYALPHALVRFNALPWAFRVDFNTDLDFQTVTYAAVHESWPARLSHLTLPMEQVAWAVLLIAWHPAALPVSTILLGLLFMHLSERSFRAYAFIGWLVICAVAVALVAAKGTAPLLLPAKELLLVGPGLRFIGHAFDPIPPWVGTEGDVFVPLSQAKLGWRWPFVPFAGWLSEAAAALPYRLFWVQLFWACQKFGYRPQATRSWSEASVVGADIRRDGWKAYDKTARLFPEVVPWM